MFHEFKSSISFLEISSVLRILRRWSLKHIFQLLLSLPLECCGVHTVDDWQEVFKTGITAPSSCCIEKGETCVNTSRQGMHELGCYAKLQDKVKSGVICLAGIGIGIAFIELAGIVLALLLVHAIRTSAQK